VTRPLFQETVTALVESFAPPPGTGLVVESATLDLPLEGSVELDRSGVPVFRAAPPHTRWRSGLLPPVHLAHLELVSLAADEGEHDR
jgi:hypothetical protein